MPASPGPSGSPKAGSVRSEKGANVPSKSIKPSDAISNFGDVVTAALVAIDDPTAPFDLPADASGSPAASIAHAMSLEELDAATGAEATKMEDVAGVPLRVLSFKVLPSDFTAAEGLPFFLVASCETANGIEQVIVGGAAPCAYLLRRYQLGGIPMEPTSALVFSRALKPTRAGYFPWNVKRVDVTRDEAGNLF